MIKKLTEKKQKENQTYNFEQTPGIAGICPDCGCIVHFNSYHQRFECCGKNCVFEANAKGERVWDNKMRDENLRKMKESQVINIL